MVAQLADLERYYRRGEAMGATHMIIAVDWFDYTEYPIYVMPGQNPRNMRPSQDRVMECYSYELGWAAQARGRANNWEMPGIGVPVLVRLPQPITGRGLPVTPGTTIKVVWREPQAAVFAGDLFTRGRDSWRGRRSGLMLTPIALTDLIEDYSLVAGPATS